MEVCIIGAGFSGIAAAKACLTNGMTPFILNKQSAFGGVWRGFPGQTGVWDTLRINTNKYVFVYSDMPWDADAPAYPSGKQMAKYLKAYVNKHNLQQYMHHNCEVLLVDKSGEDYLVRWKCFDTVHEKVFKAVAISTGRFSSERNPLKHPEIFQGEIFKGGIYREPSVFAGKKVVVVGKAFTGSDVAAEAAETATSVTHIFRREFIVIQRFVHGIPYHFHIFPIVNPKKPHFVPTLEQYEESSQQLLQLFGNMSEIHPECGFDEASLKTKFPKFVLYSDVYLNAMRERLINVMKGNAVEFYENGVILEDGRRVEADVVVLAAGYKCEYPFLSDEIKRTIKYDPQQRVFPRVLYRSILHPDLPRMCFLGTVDGDQPAEHEMPAEIGMRYINGTLNISREEMEEGLRIEEHIRTLAANGLADPYDFEGYMYELMRILGIELDMEFIGGELGFAKGPILSCFLTKMTEEQKDICRRVVAEIKARYPSLILS